MDLYSQITCFPCSAFFLTGYARKFMFRCKAPQESMYPRHGISYKVSFSFLLFSVDVFYYTLFLTYYVLYTTICYSYYLFIPLLIYYLWIIRRSADGGVYCEPLDVTHYLVSYFFSTFTFKLSLCHNLVSNIFFTLAVSHPYVVFPPHSSQRSVSLSQSLYKLACTGGNTLPLSSSLWVVGI